MVLASLRMSCAFTLTTVEVTSVIVKDLCSSSQIMKYLLIVIRISTDFLSLVNVDSTGSRREHMQISSLMYSEAVLTVYRTSIGGGHDYLVLSSTNGQCRISQSEMLSYLCRKLIAC